MIPSLKNRRFSGTNYEPFNQYIGTQLIWIPAQRGSQPVCTTASGSQESWVSRASSRECEAGATCYNLKLNLLLANVAFITGSQSVKNQHGQATATPFKAKWTIRWSRTVSWIPSGPRETSSLSRLWDFLIRPGHVNRTGPVALRKGEGRGWGGEGGLSLRQKSA